MLLRKSISESCPITLPKLGIVSIRLVVLCILFFFCSYIRFSLSNNLVRIPFCYISSIQNILLKSQLSFLNNFLNFVIVTFHFLLIFSLVNLGSIRFKEKITKLAIAIPQCNIISPTKAEITYKMYQSN